MADFNEDEVSGNPVVVPTIITEFGYNTDVTATATVTTGSASGTSGVNFSSNWAVGTAYVRRVSFSSNNLVDDIFHLEHDAGSSGATWFDASSLYPYLRQGTNEYGMTITAGTNYVDVAFSGGGFNANGATYIANGSAWTTQSTRRWRVRRTRFTTTAYGAGEALANRRGLVFRTAPSVYTWASPALTTAVGYSPTAFTEVTEDTVAISSSVASGGGSGSSTGLLTLTFAAAGTYRIEHACYTASASVTTYKYVRTTFGGTATRLTNKATFDSSNEVNNANNDLSGNHIAIFSVAAGQTITINPIGQINFAANTHTIGGSVIVTML